MLTSRVELPRDASAPGRARQELRQVLAGAAAPEWADAAELAVSEVVTNATLHAHTAVEMTVWLEPARLRVEVRDFSPVLPLQRRYGEHATTGRGMALVSALTSSCGTTRLDDGKVVWFVLEARAAEVCEEDLLAAFDDARWDLDESPPDPSATGTADPSSPAAAPPPELRRVRLLGVPPTLWLAAREHHDALLRELALYLPAHRGAPAGTSAAPSPSSTAATGGQDPVLTDLDAVDLPSADAARHHVSDVLGAALEEESGSGPGPLSALPAGHPSPLPPSRTTLDVELELPAGLGPDLAALQDALDTAERLAVGGHLLAFPGQPEVVAVRDWVTEQIQAQLSGVSATAWPGTDDQRFESSSQRHEGLDAIAAAVEFVRGDPRGVVAADEGNRIVAVSDVLAVALGWQGADLLGRRVVALIPPALREAHVAGFTRHLSTGRAHVLGVPLTLPVQRADGTQVNCDFMVEQVPAPPGRSLYLAWITPLAHQEPSPRTT